MILRASDVVPFIKARARLAANPYHVNMRNMIRVHFSARHSTNSLK